jgi:hypothetical protein
VLNLHQQFVGRFSGKHCARTCEDWLAKMNAIGSLWKRHMERKNTAMWFYRWQIVYMARAEMFTYEGRQYAGHMSLSLRRAIEWDIPVASNLVVSFDVRWSARPKPQMIRIALSTNATRVCTMRKVSNPSSAQLLLVVSRLLLNGRHAPKGDSIQEAQGRLSSHGTSAVHLCQLILRRYWSDIKAHEEPHARTKSSGGESIERSRRFDVGNWVWARSSHWEKLEFRN